VLAVAKEHPAPGLAFGAERPAPHRLPGEALLRPLLAGVCGTDLHIETWEGPYRDLAPYLPVVLGHEFVAEVVEGERMAPGERVVAISVYGCGRCELCRSGRPQLCPEARRESLGMSRDGGLAELVAIPEERLLRVPEGIPGETAALCEPFATAVRAASRHRAAGWVAVLGPGVIGLMVALVAALDRPDRLVVVGRERDCERLELARSLGMETAAIPDESGEEALVEALGGEADLVFEAAGSSGAVQAGLRALAPEGCLATIGMHDRPVPLPLGTLVRGERRIDGSYAAGPGDWRTALDLLGERVVDLRPLAGPAFDLEDAETAFRATERGVAGRALVRCAG
jgi:threonine dehydrogenase-like Zn-dependent dehydrogenase